MRFRHGKDGVIELPLTNTITTSLLMVAVRSRRCEEVKHLHGEEWKKSHAPKLLKSSACLRLSSRSLSSHGSRLVQSSLSFRLPLRPPSLRATLAPPVVQQQAFPLRSVPTRLLSHPTRLQPWQQVTTLLYWSRSPSRIRSGSAVSTRSSLCISSLPVHTDSASPVHHSYQARLLVGQQYVHVRP